jgi:UDP-N-acetylglucosamine:LPS N-acetylglucosamine transferase
MKRILICWELGGGYGHLYPLLPFASEFKRLGHDVVVAVKDLARAEQVFGRHDIKILQAPTWWTPERSFPISVNYAQNLFRNGYWYGPALTGNLKAWLNLFDLWQPVLVFTDHAPTALLAARSAGIPRAAVGSGFVLPPLLSPMPSLQPWFPIPQKILDSREKEVLDQINSVLKALGFNILDCVADLFEGTEIFLTTFSELDHYGPRSGVRYWGPIVSSGNGIGSTWEKRGDKKVFIYLNYRYRFLKEIFQQIRKLDLPTLAFIRDMPEKSAETLGGRNIEFAPGPVSLERAVEQSSLVITHGGVNTSSFLLLSGKPLLILPEQLEQCLWAYRVTEQNLGLMVNWFQSRPDFGRNLGELLESQTVLERVSQFAHKYKGYDSQDTVHKICRLLS